MLEPTRTEGLVRAGLLSWSIPAGICAMAGVLLARAWPSPTLWLSLAWLAVALTAGLWPRVNRQDRPRLRAGLVLSTLAVLMAAWTSAREELTPADSIQHRLTNQAQLAEITGVVVGEMKSSRPSGLAMQRFGYRRPNHRCTVELRSIATDSGPVPASGRVQLVLAEPDQQLRPGLGLRALGWLSQPMPAKNPGEFDYAAYLEGRGIYGVLRVASVDHWQPELGLTSGVDRLRAWQDQLGQAAQRSLALGLEGHEEITGLLDALLLGRRSGLDPAVMDDFRRVGLAHVLSISGAHLGILLGLVWLVARWFLPHPRRAAGVVLITLLLFAFAVPMRTPLLRAAIMAGVFALGIWSGRRARAIDLLALAGIIVLVWRPAELFDSGFQLSFAAVWAILRFAEPAMQRLGLKQDLLGESATGVVWVGRWVAECAVVSTLAFLAVTPLVMQHFQLIVPAAMVLSLLALPVLTVILALGYVKLIVGLALPSVSWLLAGPLQWATATLTGMVDQSIGWPGVSIELPQAPGPAWTLCASAFIFAGLELWTRGWPRSRWQRRAGMATAVLILTGWLSLTQGWVGGETPDLDAPPTLTMHAIAVGNGSAFVLQSDGQAVLYDCGSGFVGIGRHAVLPTLRELGVRRLDAVILSHADLDHIVGVLDVVAKMPIDRAWVSPDLPESAAENPAGAPAFVLDGLAQRNIPTATLNQGDVVALGRYRMDVLWPPINHQPKRNNDRSLVLRVARDADPRACLLLTGDIEQEGILALLDHQPDALGARVLTLPHHGSFVQASPDLLHAVSPEWTVQSSSRRDPSRRDPWAEVLRKAQVPRLITGETGLISLTIAADEPVEISTYLEPAQQP